MRIEVEELETADYDILENIKTAFYRLWKLKLVVIIMTLIGFLVFFVFIGVVGVHTTYSSTATIFSAVYGSYQDSADGVTVMNKYASLLGTSRVCSRAAASLNNVDISAETLRGLISSGNIYLVGASNDSKSYGYKLTLVVRLNSAENIQDITNAVAKAFADEINDLLGVSTLQVLDEATSYSVSKSINVKLYFALFGLASFVGTAGIIFLKEFFSPKVYSVAQCEHDERQILGLIPYDIKSGKQ